MSEAFRPMALGEILDRTSRLMRAHWRVFTGIAVVPAAIIMLPTYGLMAWFLIALWPRIFAQGGALPHFPIYLPILFVAVGNLLPIPVFALYVPAGIYAAVQANLGAKVTLHDAYAVAWRHYGRYLWLMVLVIVYVAGPFILAAALIGGGALLMVHGAQPGSIPTGVYMLIPAAILSYLGFLVYSILMMLRFAVAYPACVVEDLPAPAALRRSTSLTCGARGRIFAAMLVVYAVVYAASMVVMIAVGIVGSLGALAATAAHVAAGSPAFFLLIGLAAIFYLTFMIVYAGFTYAAMTTVLAVIYHDQRWRKDGVAATALPA
jgi:hypothetical protein